MRRQKKQNNENENYKKGFILKVQKTEDGIEEVTYEEVEFKKIWYFHETAEIKKTTYISFRDVYETEEKAIATAAYHNSKRALKKTQKKWWQIWK